MGALADNRSRAAAWLWLGCVQFFVAERLATLGWVGRYSYRTNYISDLGALSCSAAICSHWHRLMDSSFFLQAVLIAVGALLLPIRFSPGWAGRVSRGLLLLSAFGIYDVAVAPEDVNMNKHIFGAGLHFFSGSLAMLFWGLSLVLCRGGSSRERSQQVKIALLAAAVAVTGDFLVIHPIDPVNAVLGLGWVERLAAYPLPLWLAWTGWTMLRGRREL